MLMHDASDADQTYHNFRLCRTNSCAVSWPYELAFFAAIPGTDNATVLQPDKHANAGTFSAPYSPANCQSFLFADVCSELSINARAISHLPVAQSLKSRALRRRLRGVPPRAFLRRGWHRLSGRVCSLLDPPLHPKGHVRRSHYTHLRGAAGGIAARVHLRRLFDRHSGRRRGSIERMRGPFGGDVARRG